MDNNIPLPSHDVRVRFFVDGDLIDQVHNNVFNVEEAYKAYNHIVATKVSDSALHIYMITLFDLDTAVILAEKTIRYTNVHKLPPEIEQIIWNG